MSAKTTVVTESAESFLARVKDVARKLDEGEAVAPSRTISYGEPTEPRLDSMNRGDRDELCPR